MPKSLSPLLGYNTNVRHKGKTYHIQTEDSGRQRPHVITHIFADGGRIVASRKTDYSNHLNDENLEEIVRNLMKAQHKDMVIALRDETYEESSPADTQSSGPNIHIQTAAAHLIAHAPLDSSTDSPRTEDAPIASTKSVPPKRKSVAPRGRGPDPDIEAFDKAAEAHIQHSSLRSVLIPRSQKSQPPKPAMSSPPARPKKEESRASKQRIVSIFGSDPSNEKSLDEVIISYLTDDDRKKK
jgi:hypothetical protein